MTHPARWPMVTAHQPASVRHWVDRERPQSVAPGAQLSSSLRTFAKTMGTRRASRACWCPEQTPAAQSDGPRCSCRPVVTRPPLRASHKLVTCERRYHDERLSNRSATITARRSTSALASLGSPLRCYMSLRRLGIVCGILGPLLWLSLIGMAGAMRPEFSHITHYISELGERGSSLM